MQKGDGTFSVKCTALYTHGVADHATLACDISLCEHDASRK